MPPTPKEEEYVQIAKKYIPDLKSEQEDFVRSIARCKKYGASESNVPTFSEVCGCGLCLRMAVWKLQNPKPKLIMESLKFIYGK